MKKIIKNFKWNTILVLIFLFTFSALCWLNCAKSIRSIVLSYLKNSNSAVVNQNTLAETTEIYDLKSDNANTEDKIAVNTDFFELIDGGINKLDSFWYGNMFQKSSLSKMDSLFTYFLTGQVSSSQVVKGKEKWLFYVSPTDANPIADYEGTNRYSNSELQEMLTVSLDTQNIIESKGIKFAIIIPPNKENIYSEYMPDTYQHVDISSTDILIDYLKRGGVNIISPKMSILDNHMDMQLYYSYDTHWNQLGAYIGVKEVLDAWGIEIPELSERNVLSSNLRDNYHYCGEDDLAKMIGLTFIFNDEVEYEVEGTGIMDWERFANEQEQGEISHFVNEDALFSGSIMLIGDSFRSSMVPALREVYFDVYVVPRSFYSPEMLNEVNPDYLIVEYVERYSERISEMYSLIE